MVITSEIELPSDIFTIQKSTHRNGWRDNQKRWKRCYENIENIEIRKSPSVSILIYSIISTKWAKN